jgi:hypothetical protein
MKYWTILSKPKNQKKRRVFIMLKTNSKQVKETVREYIKDHLEVSILDFFIQFQDEFNSSYNIQRYPNTQTRFIEYLKGLPTNSSFAFYNDEITELVNSWVQNTDNKKFDITKTIDLYYYLISREFFILLKNEESKNKDI